MRPYRILRCAIVLGFTVLATASLNAFANGAPPVHEAQAAEEPGQPPKVLGRRLSKIDSETISANGHLYNLQYDKAIAEFERVCKKYPEDPFPINHFAQAMLLKELYRLNALDTTLYADNGFLTGKPLPGDPKVKAKILELVDTAIQLAEKRLKVNSNDVEALYARGVSRSIRLSYLGIVEKSFLSAFRNMSGARNDHERVLQLEPNFTDAKLIVGLHNYVIGSLPFAVRMMAGVAGISGSKKKGIEYLYQVANANGDTSVDARVTLALFLRREASYLEALQIARTLTAQYPHNFIFALEEANLLKDSGQGPEAIAAYSKLLKDAEAGQFFEPHMERAQFGLAESLRGQHKPEDALGAYQTTLAFSAPTLQPEIKIRSLFGSGLMYDVLDKRDAAIKNYQEVVAMDPTSSQAVAARKLLKERYRYP